MILGPTGGWGKRLPKVDGQGGLSWYEKGGGRQGKKKLWGGLGELIVLCKIRWRVPSKKFCLRAGKKPETILETQ